MKNKEYGPVEMLGHAIAGAAVIGVAYTLMEAYTSGTLKELPPHPDGQFELVSINETNTTLKQEGKNYVIETKSLPDKVKQDLIKKRPDLRAFIANGSINIVNTNQNNNEKQKIQRIGWLNKATGATGKGEFLDEETAFQTFKDRYSSKDGLEYWIEDGDGNLIFDETHNKLSPKQK